MDNYNVLIPIECDEEYGVNVEIGEMIQVSREDGATISCRCVGWKRNQQGVIYIKTDNWFGVSNVVPMERVQIIITPREAKLREKLAALEELQHIPH